MTPPGNRKESSLTKLKDKKLSLEPALWINNCKGLGDVICATPVARHLSEVYQKPITVATYQPEVFKRSPYIDRVFDFNKAQHLDKRPKYDIHDTFMWGNWINNRVIKYAHSNVTITHAMCLGFYLTDEDKTLDFFAKPYKPIKDLPEDYIVIHPSITWPSRTWTHWQEFIDKCDLPVVIVGKEGPQVPSGEHEEDKGIFKLNISNGLDLTNKLDLSQTWHILNKARVIITTDSGLLHLAGTTDTHIILLNSMIHPEYKLPYRKGSQYYKVKVLQGTCNKYCASDMKYHLKVHNTIEGLPPIDKCLENYDTFECHATADQLLDAIDLNTWSNNETYR